MSSFGSIPDRSARDGRVSLRSGALGRASVAGGPVTAVAVERVVAAGAASVGGGRHREIEYRLALVLQQLVVNELLRVDPGPFGSGAQVVVDVGRVVGRRTEWKEEVRLGHHPGDERIRSVRRLRYDPATELGIAHRPDLLRQRQVGDRSVARIEHEGMEGKDRKSTRLNYSH